VGLNFRSLAPKNLVVVILHYFAVRTRTIRERTISKENRVVGSLSILQAKMRKIKIAFVVVKQQFWPSSRWNFLAFRGPVEEIQAWSNSTLSIVWRASACTPRVDSDHAKCRG